MPRIGQIATLAEKRDTFTRLPWHPNEGHREGVQMISDAQAAEAPHIVIPTQPKAIPPELLALQPDAIVCYSQARNPGAYLQSAFGTAEHVVRLINETIARQEAGRFYLFEAAQILADENGLSARDLLRDMHRAFEDGRLRFRSLSTGLPVSPRGPCGDYVTPADLNTWLEAYGADYRFQAPQTAATPTTAPSASPAPSDDLILELRRHREAIERAAHEADQRHAHEQAQAGFARIRAATVAGIKAMHATQKPSASPAPAVAIRTRAMKTPQANQFNALNALTEAKKPDGSQMFDLLAIPRLEGRVSPAKRYIVKHLNLSDDAAKLALSALEKDKKIRYADPVKTTR